jgi:hypothetical protein
MAYSMLWAYPLANPNGKVEFVNVMRWLILFGLMSALAAPAAGQNTRGLSREQNNAYRAMQQGQILSLPEIRSRIRVPGAEYIGAEMVGPTVYRLKYMRGPNVIWIDVDAASGRIVARFGM